MTKKLAPDLSKLEEVAEKVATKLIHEGIDHALIGGLAVARWGYPRATADVDFLLAPDDLAKLSGTPNAIGLSERVDGIRVDYIAAEPWEENLLDAIFETTPGEAIDIADLIYLKLKANRRKDQADVVELVKRGRVPLVRVRAYLKAIDDADIISDFELSVLTADSEGD